MASIIISGNTMKDVPEVSEMLDDLLKGRITMSRFIKFLDDNNLETKVRCVNKDINPSALVDFVGDTISTIFSIPKKSECENVEDDDVEETEDVGCKNPDKFWKETNEEYEKHVKDTVKFAKRLIDDYGDSEEDDIEHAKAVKLFHSLMILGRTYRIRANKGDAEYNIPSFSPENILKFIKSIGLPIDKIKAASERGRSNYYKTKNYEDFDDFVSSMKDVFGIEDVWNPPKEVPEWFESIRNKLYRKFYPTEDVLIDKSEWEEFEKWKKNKDKCNDDYAHTNEKKIDAKESYENQCRSIVNTIIDEFSPILTGKALKHFEKMYKSYNNTFMKQLKSLYSTVKSAKDDGLMCFIDIENDSGTIICNPIPNTKKDIEETILDTLSESDSKESSNKKSSTSKKTTTTSAKKVKVSVNTSAKSKTDTGTKLKEFKGYADYILLNSSVEDDARELLLSYAANMDEKCKKLYDYLVNLKKRKKSVKLIKYYDEKIGDADIGFAEL